MPCTAACTAKPENLTPLIITSDLSTGSGVFHQRLNAAQAEGRFGDSSGLSRHALPEVWTPHPARRGSAHRLHQSQVPSMRRGVRPEQALSASRLAGWRLGAVTVYRNSGSSIGRDECPPKAEHYHKTKRCLYWETFNALNRASRLQPTKLTEQKRTRKGRGTSGEDQGPITPNDDFPRISQMILPSRFISDNTFQASMATLLSSTSKGYNVATSQVL